LETDFAAAISIFLEKFGLLRNVLPNLDGRGEKALHDRQSIG